MQSLRKKLVRAFTWAKVYWVALVATIGLVLVLLWRALRHGENFTEGLEKDLELEQSALREVVRQSELEKARRTKAAELAKAEADNAVHLERISNMDATHVADEWKRLRAGKVE